jgi:hypothetical protein
MLRFNAPVAVRDLVLTPEVDHSSTGFDSSSPKSPDGPLYQSRFAAQTLIVSVFTFTGVECTPKVRHVRRAGVRTLA